MQAIFFGIRQDFFTPCRHNKNVRACALTVLDILFLCYWACVCCDFRNYYLDKIIKVFGIGIEVAKVFDVIDSFGVIGILCEDCNLMLTEQVHTFPFYPFRRVCRDCFSAYS